MPAADCVTLGQVDLHFDPQQTGFKGNLRLLIKPFEQPHLPFKILSAALHYLPSTACLEPAAFSSASHNRGHSVLGILAFRSQKWVSKKKKRRKLTQLCLWIRVCIFWYCAVLFKSAKVLRCFESVFMTRSYVVFAFFFQLVPLTTNFRYTVGEQDTQLIFLSFKLNSGEYKLLTFAALWGQYINWFEACY